MASNRDPKRKKRRYSTSKVQKLQLSDRHRATIDTYMSNDFDKKAAMLANGYSLGTSTTRQGLVFDRQDVRNAIDRRMQASSDHADLDAEWVLKRLMAIADGGATLAKFKIPQADGSLAWDFTGATPKELALIKDMGVEFYTEGRGASAIEVKKFKVKTEDQMSALTAIMRYLGMNNDKIEVTDATDLNERIQAGRHRVAKAKKDDDDDTPTVH